MVDFYKKYEDHTLDFQGKKYFEKTFVIGKMNNLMDTSQQLQQRSYEAEKLLDSIHDHWFVKLLFSKKIKKHFEKYKNFKLKF